MVSSHLYVEGGGDSKALRTACREGFRSLLERAGLQGRLPRISACGGRRQAYDDFCRAAQGNEGTPYLLVDSEDAVETDSPWEHVKTRRGDGWEKPTHATDDQLHLMVQCMEAWLVADRGALARYWGHGVRDSALPAATAPIEKVSKLDLYDRLKQATKDSKTKGVYSKAVHSFELLKTLDPAVIRNASPWAARFFATLGRLL